VTESQPERLSPDELRELFLFESLHDDQLAWLAKSGRIVEYPAGAIIASEGAPASCFLVLLSGMLSMSRRVQGGEIELFRTEQCGSYTGAFDFYRLDQGVPQVYPGTTRAVTDCRLFELPATELGRAFREWFPMAIHFLEGLATTGMDTRDVVERHERLVALGSVTAGLTHELNNPVAAVARGTAMLRERLAGMRAELGTLARGALSGEQLEAVATLAGEAIDERRQAPHLTPLEVSDREEELADWLDDHGVDGGWDLAPILVGSGLTVAWAERLAEAVPAAHLGAALTYPVRALETDGLLDEISEAVGRISGLLASAKQYTQMDRTPLQTFDVHAGLDATLTMLGHKLEDGIEVVRDYDRSLPPIVAYAAELNQVWTNLIDNAVDAMDGRGTLTLRTYPAGDDRLVVEIGDTGPGVPSEIRTRVFEPFFTTKEIGRGTGLGLDIAWRIVVGRHGGEINLESVPGDTRFRIVLPLRGTGSQPS
jgi:signal transduction histidine kinase